MTKLAVWLRAQTDHQDSDKQVHDIEGSVDYGYCGSLNSAAQRLRPPRSAQFQLS